MTSSSDQPYRRYVAVGDSFTEGLSDGHPTRPGSYVGWADRLAAHLAQLPADHGEAFGYANLAVRGRLLNDIAGRQVDEAIALGADLVSIVGGGNDILRPRTDVDALADRLESAVARLRGSGAAVLMATPVDPRDAPLVRRTRSRAAVYTAHIWSIARRHQAAVIDQWGMAALRDWRMWAPDRIHMTSDGHRRVALQAFTALGFDPDDSDWATPLPAAPVLSRAQTAKETAQWAREHLAPWLGRRLAGRTSGDQVLPKQALLAPPER